jgi:PIN domain nuclease of toxin-antitoxin system
MAASVACRRIDLGATVAARRADVFRIGLIELTLDATAAIRAVTLDLPHPDPADRFIVTTARLHDAMRLAADATVLTWQAPLRRHAMRA